MNQIILISGEVFFIPPLNFHKLTLEVNLDAFSKMNEQNPITILKLNRLLFYHD